MQRIMCAACDENLEILNRTSKDSEPARGANYPRLGLRITVLSDDQNGQLIKEIH